MHVAAEGGQLEMIKFLSPRCGSKVHDRDVNGASILHYAAQNSYCAVARYLIAELKLDPQDRTKVLSLMQYVCVCAHACKRGNF